MDEVVIVAAARTAVGKFGGTLGKLPAAELGAHAVARLRGSKSRVVKEVRGKGLMIGIDIDPAAGTAKDFCKKIKYI